MWRKPNETKPSGLIPDLTPAAPPKQQVTEAPSSPVIAGSQAAASSPASSTSAAPSPVQTPPPVPAFVSPAAKAPAPVVPSAPSVIGAGLKIKGEISGTSDLHIEGEANGKIQLVGGRVTVGPNGNVHADVDAREIVVEGSLQGNLKASESVHLGPASQVQGSVITPRIGIEDGARLRGKVEMLRAGESRSASNVSAEPKANTGALRATSGAAEVVPGHA